MFFHVDSGKLFSVVENIREGQDISGKELPGKSTFCIGSGIDSGGAARCPICN